MLSTEPRGACLNLPPSSGLVPSGRSHSGGDSRAPILIGFSLEAGQRPIFDRLGRRQREQKVSESVERLRLKPDGVGGEQAA
jgi:hypothetical protein